ALRRTARDLASVVSWPAERVGVAVAVELAVDVGHGAGRGGAAPAAAIVTDWAGPVGAGVPAPASPALFGSPVCNRPVDQQFATRHLCAFALLSGLPRAEVVPVVGHELLDGLPVQVSAVSGQSHYHVLDPLPRPTDEDMRGVTIIWPSSSKTFTSI